MVWLRKYIRKILREELEGYDEFIKTKAVPNKHIKTLESIQENKTIDDMIDLVTYKVNGEEGIPVKIERVIRKYGDGQTYIGKTCNPNGRMTGDYSLSESVDSSGETPEDYDAEPHDKSHDKNGYGKMFILFESDGLDEILDFEKKYVDFFKGRIRNRVAGGGGRHGDAPYYLYIIVQDEAL